MPVDRPASPRAGAKAENASLERGGDDGAASIVRGWDIATSGAGWGSPSVNGLSGGTGTALRNRREDSSARGRNGLADATMISDGAGAGSPSRNVASSI